MPLKAAHNVLIDKLKSFNRSGPPLFDRNCTRCNYNFIGTKKQSRCASCRAKKA
jgi:rubrerythrin